MSKTTEKKSKQRMKIDKDLNEEEIAYYFSLLTEEITDYDCGELCKDKKSGLTYCCQVQHAVPLLYKNELSHLQKKGDLWAEWKPGNKDDKELKETAGKDQVFCECKGQQYCIRDQRSISCRTFPLEPYIDRRGVFVGLTFIKDFTTRDADTGRIKCPLTRRKKDIRLEFIDSHFLFWEKIMLRRPEEYETYVDTSKTLRRERDRTGKSFEILYPSHFQGSKTIKLYT